MKNQTKSIQVCCAGLYCCATRAYEGLNLLQIHIIRDIVLDYKYHCNKYSAEPLILSDAVDGAVI
jgi:hypothetical protein